MRGAYHHSGTEGTEKSPLETFIYAAFSLCLCAAVVTTPLYFPRAEADRRGVRPLGEGYR
jgi:hypothetical protein